MRTSEELTFRITWYLHIHKFSSNALKAVPCQHLQNAESSNDTPKNINDGDLHLLCLLGAFHRAKER